MTTSTQWHLAREAAERYQEILVPAILGPAAQALVESTPIELGSIVLDVGCGTGAAARYAAARVGETGRVVGIDVNAAMIAVAQSLPPIEAVRIEWQEQSAYQLPLGDEIVDVVLCAQTLQFLSERPLALAEMRRVLRPGGRLALGLWCALAENPYFHTLVGAIAQHIAPETARGLNAAFGLSAAEEIRALLTDAGFGNVEMSVRQLDIDLPELPEFVPRHISATPMVTGFNAATPMAQQTVIAQVAGQLAPYQNGSGVRVPFRTHIVQAIK